MHPPRTYQQCVVLSLIARAGGAVGELELRELAGSYVTNVLEALRERELIQQLAPGVWTLTYGGRAIATELVGELDAKGDGG